MKSEITMNEIACEATSPMARLKCACDALQARMQPWVAASVLLLVRVLFGWQFYQTGKGKLANHAATTEFFASLNLPMPGLTAYMTGGLEMVGGILLLLGLMGRMTGAVLSGVMIVALLTAHRAEAFASIAGFAEQAPTPFLLAAATALAFGAGRFSVDGLMARFRKPAGHG